MVETQSKESYWREIVETWQQSKLSQVGFCKQHDLKYDVFVYWRCRFLKQEKQAGKFMAVTLKNDSSTKPKIQPVITGTNDGLTVYLNQGINTVIKSEADVELAVLLIKRLGES